MRYRTINPDTATPAECQALAVLGLDVGDRLYVQKRGRLTATMVHEAARTVGPVGGDHGTLVSSLAMALKRDRATIARHLRRLRSNPDGAVGQSEGEVQL